MTRPIRLLFVAVSIVLAVAACGGGSSSKDAGKKNTTTAASSGSAASGATTADSATSGSATSGKCKEGLGTFAGVQARTFCGPATATATVTVGATPLSFKGGECQSGTGYLTVNIGTVALGALKDPAQKPAYFGLLAGDLSKAPGGSAAAGGENSPAITGDGVYAGQPLITGNSGATAIVLKTSMLTLSDGQKKGTFTGTGLDGSAVTGSFACG